LDEFPAIEHRQACLTFPIQFSRYGLAGARESNGIPSSGRTQTETVTNDTPMDSGAQRLLASDDDYPCVLWPEKG
jgi:hypothetical protein